jgi:signal peptidase I
VVIFKAPATEPCAEDECEYIKRVIGLPGEEVKVEENHIFINGKRLDEDYLFPNVVIEGGNFLQEGKAFLIPSDSYIVLGDNRPHSRDSREFGSINKQSIVGKAFVRYWPLKAFGLIPEPTYNL